MEFFLARVRCSYGNLLIAVANLLIPVAVLTFAAGFFPYKPFVPGLAQYHSLDFGDPPSSQFDKVVFMVVDALRSDFVFSETSGFAFTQSLIRSGDAVPFTAHATSPTITMPRVKAITTGSVPSFLDVILNFAESDTTSTLADQDTWLAQMKNKKDGRLVMYGDDTWLKLFPNTFSRFEGTSSFFVSDYTEVDNNVTRHVPRELRAHDWDAMILHYLGLDHIGHKTGPLSPNMLPKQREMDEIVQQVYEGMTSFAHLNSTLLVLCGDHGMNDGGNHGGSAPGETSPALVFISPRLRNITPGRPCPTSPHQEYDYYDKIEQSDIAATLAGLLGFPIPLNNLGVFIQDFLPLWRKPTDQLQLLFRNALQILDIVKVAYPNEVYDDCAKERFCDQAGSSGEELACLWQNAVCRMHVSDSPRPLTDDVVKRLFEFCRRAQDVMSSTASNYDLARLLSGIGLAALSLLLSVPASWKSILSTKSDGLFLLLLLTLYGTMTFASSYVEEEQHFWYWMTGCWIVFQSIPKFQHAMSQINASKLLVETALRFVGLLASHRITQRWNQTGQKFSGAANIVHDFFLPRPILLWLLVALTYFIIWVRVRRHISQDLRAGRTVGGLYASIFCGSAFVFKLGFTASDAPELLSWLGKDAVVALQGLPLVASARTIFFAAACELVWALSSRWNVNEERIRKKDLITTLQDVLNVFLITQTRVTNIPLYLAFQSQENILSTFQLTPAQITIFSLLLGHTSFFVLGNSNAISSIDLSNAYNGVSGFSVVAVGLLLFASNWAGPIWWSMTGIKLLIHSQYPKEEPQSKDAFGRDSSRRKWVEQEMQHLLSPESASPPVATSKAVLREDVSTPFMNHISLLTLFTSSSLLAVMIACTLLRTHLFVWTVFSPKYLYAMAWSLGFHFFVSIGIGGWLWWICGGVEE